MPPIPFATVAELVASRARVRPCEAGLYDVRFEGRVPRATPCTYDRLWATAVRAATMLAGDGILPGDRVLLAIDSPSEFLAFFVGAQSVGAIPVPMPSLAGSGTAGRLQRLVAVTRDARPKVLVVDANQNLDAIPEWIKREARVRQAFAVAATSDVAAETDRPQPARSPDEIAFLQYTSGSTGSPKGVVVLHRNVVANVRAIAEAGHAGADDVVLSWLPLYHDMGLLALLLGLYLGAPAYIARPSTFGLRPESWVRAVSTFRATISPGPNFAYDVLASRVPDRVLDGVDLSSWRLAFVGAEPVVPSTMRAFAARYASFGFTASALRPGYGMAECTLGGAFPPVGAPIRFDRVDRAALLDRGVAVPAGFGAAGTVEYTGVGGALPGHDVRVVEIGSDRELPDRHVGEIILGGPSVTPGYFDEGFPPSSARTRLRTGDLGYMAEGELFVVDRIKDLVVVAGRKYPARDLERVLESVEGIRPGAVVAFSAVRDSGSESLYVAAALDAVAADRRAGFRIAIRRALHDAFGLTPQDVFLLRGRDIPRTSSGKVRRSACRRMLESGTLDSLGTAQSLDRELG